MGEEIRRVRFRSQERESVGELKVKHFNRREQLLQAGLTCVIGSIATVVAIFMPLVHFVLVPLGALLTIVLTKAALSRTSKILGGSGACPQCGATVTIHPRADVERFEDLCEGCRRRILIESAATSAA